jgi:uncharacterized repeat protein (TIGR03833 family)
MNGSKRSDIKPGMHVKIIMKKDQRSDELTEPNPQIIPME